MAAQLEKLALDLKQKGFSVGAERTRAFANELLKDRLIPYNLAYASTPIPDLSYMATLEEDPEPIQGKLNAQIKEYRSELGLNQIMFGELIGLNNSSMSRLESGAWKPTEATQILNLVGALRLGKRQAESLIEAAGFSPKLIELILRHQV
jgi:DNA-binding XRE family transcriptional regulator